MNELDFHIDETVIHSATIDQKKDFDQLMVDFEATQVKQASLNSYWMMSSVVIVLAISALAAFDGQEVVSSGTDNHQAAITEKTQIEEASLLASAPVFNTDILELEEVVLDEAIIESVVNARIALDKVTETAVSTSIKEPILEPSSPRKLKRNSIAEAMIKHPVAVRTSQPKAIPVSSVKVPSGIELNVDLITYAELKKNKHYFFEIDTLKSDAGKELFDMDWEEADLKRHPDKGRYRMILKRQNEHREIVVRLVKNSMQSVHTRKWRLFARR